MDKQILINTFLEMYLVYIYFVLLLKNNIELIPEEKKIKYLIKTIISS